MILTETNMKEVFYWHMLASMPGFLYKKLRELKVIQQMADEMSVDELLKIYTNSAKNEETGGSNEELIESSPVGYAALVAITLKNHKEAVEALEKLRAYDLHWAKDMIHRFMYPNVKTWEHMEADGLQSIKLCTDSSVR